MTIKKQALKAWERLAKNHPEIYCTTPQYAFLEGYKIGVRKGEHRDKR
jgi:hypothetical protein